MKPQKTFGILFATIGLVSSSVATAAVTMSTEEQKLYQLLNEYRLENNLPAIPASPSLTLVAQTHAKDLDTYPPALELGCNLHSWSSNGAWSSCCYTEDHAQAQCMWDKPKELTSYTADGYEMAHGGSGVVMDAQSALDAWKASNSHNEVMLNQGSFSVLSWGAVGIGIYGGYASVWFGQAAEEEAGTTSARITNISTRANVSGGQNDALAGFVLSGSSTRQIMLRGIAVQNGVDPLLTLLKRNSNGTAWDSVAVNDEWENDVNAGSVDSLSEHLRLPDTYGNDAGALLHLEAGVYTAQLSSNAEAGLEVVGVDAVGDAGPILMNISTRAYISGGENDVFAGFVITGSGSLTAMLRGIAVADGVDPSLTLLKYNGSTWDTVAVNDEWENDANAAAVNALPVNLRLPDTYGNDAGILLDLSAGVYTAQLSSSSGPGLAVVGVDVVE